MNVTNNGGSSGEHADEEPYGSVERKDINVALNGKHMSQSFAHDGPPALSTTASPKLAASK